MGLLTIIKKQKQKDKEIRCLILGLDNSGKSTIVNKLLPIELRKRITPTIGFEIHSINTETNLISLWDIGGQISLRKYWDNYFDITDVFIWCIDISNDRYNESLIELESRIDNNVDIPLIIVFNKIDLIENEQDKMMIVNDLMKRIKLIKKQIKISFIECSGLTGIGINELLKEISECKVI